MVSINSQPPDTLLKTQFDILFANSRWLVVGQLLLATTMVFWLWGQSSALAISLWFLCICIPPLYRANLTRRYHQNLEKPMTYWQLRYLAGSCIFGFIWGSLVFIELPIISFYFILFVLGGYMVVTVGSSSTYLPAVFYFIFPVGLCISAKCYLLSINAPNQDWLFIFIIVLFAFLVIMISAKVLNKTIETGLKLRFENMDLVASLQEQKAQVELAKTFAEKANEDKSRFLAAASHDLRQPLHAMSLFLDAIRLCDEKNERLALYGKLEKSVDSLGELFNALLDISKMDAESIDIQPTTFYIADMIKNVVNEFEIEAKNKGVTLSFMASELTVLSDQLWLERIVRNLVSNAIRYTDSGRVLISCRKRQDACLIQVWDQGCGIGTEQQEIIFQEFTQLNNPHRDRSQGLGLGLAIVKRLTNLLGHSISLRSQKGKGSVFSLLIPLSDSNIVENPKELTLPTTNKLKGKRILVVDDEPSIRVAMSSMLEKWGCYVMVAESLDATLKVLSVETEPPSLVLSDYRLADGETGLQILSAVNQHYRRDIKSILITGETEVATIRQISDSGHKVLHKPIRPAKLRLMMNNLVDE